jgi:hypothetical protein
MPGSADPSAGTSAGGLRSAGGFGPQAEALPSVAESSGPETPAWSLGGSIGTYVVPHERDYTQPTLTADRDWLHFEWRYNYESYDTGSLWLGCNFSVGDKLTLGFTPMVGGVFGDVFGVAPGAKLTLEWWKLDFFTEAEYLFDTDHHDDSFTYAWSELAISPLEWLRLGLVSDRTRAFDTDVDIQRGLLAGVSYRWLSFTAYVFNLDQSEQTVVLSVGVEL